VNDTACIHPISLTVYVAIATTQQKHPEWLVEKYRNLAWRSPQYEKAFTTKLSAELDKVSSRAEQIQKVRQCLEKIMTLDFFQSIQFAVLMDELEQSIGCSAKAITEKRTVRKQRYYRASRQTEPIALLLLDVENIRLSTIQEQFLQAVCQYPMQIKMAFANWRSIGKLDAEFHARGYQMIHVPPGKNSADMQMTAIGSSLFLQYPNIKAAVVCSSDNHLIPLCNLLQTQGLVVYSACKRNSQLLATHYSTGKTEVLTCGTVDIGSRFDLQHKLAELLLDLTAQSPGSFIHISTLSHEFKQRYGQPISESIKDWDLSGKYLKFLKSCSIFELQEVDQQWQIAIADSYSRVLV
jgi:hypothetical protein